MPRAIDPSLNGGGIPITHSPLNRIPTSVIPHPMDLEKLLEDVINGFSDSVRLYIFPAIEELTGIDLSAFLPLLNLLELDFSSPEAFITSLVTAILNVPTAVVSVLVSLVEQFTHPDNSDQLNTLLAGLINLLITVPTMLTQLAEGLIDSGAGMLGIQSPLNALNLFNLVPTDLLSHIPMSNIGTAVTNLLTDPHFLDTALADVEGWIHDLTGGFGGIGSMSTVADGTTKELLGNLIPVSEGQILPISGKAKWSGLSNNLVTDGSFEDTSYTLGGREQGTQVVHTTEVAHSGAHSIKVTQRDAGGETTFFVVDDMPAQPGQQFSVETWVFPKVTNLAAGSDFEDQPNLVPSPGFEDATAVVRASGGPGTWTYSTAEKHSGAQSYQATITGTPDLGSVYSYTNHDRVSVQPGQQIDVEVWLKNTNSSGTMAVGLEFTDSTGTTPASGTSTIWVDAVPNVWTKYVGRSVIPAGFDQMLPYVQVINGPVGHTYFFDDVVVRKSHPWSLGTGWSVATDQFHSGTKSLKLGPTAHGGTVSLTGGPFTVTPGEQFSMEFWARRDAAYDGVDGQAKLRVGNQGGSYVSDIGFSTAQLPTPGVWVRQSVTFTVPAGATALEFDLNDQSTAGSVWIDDIIIRREPGTSHVMLYTVHTDSHGVNPIDFGGLYDGSPAKGVWTKLSGTDTIPAGYDTVRFALSVRGDNAVGDVVYWDDAVVTRVSAAGPIALGITGYLTNGATTQSVIASHSTTPPTTDWLTLSGTYTVPANVTSLRTRLIVASGATAGTVSFSDLSVTKIGAMLQNLIRGTNTGEFLPDDVGHLFGGIMTNATSLLSKVEQSAHDALLNTLGGNLTQIDTRLQSFLDSLSPLNASNINTGDVADEFVSGVRTTITNIFNGLFGLSETSVGHLDALEALQANAHALTDHGAGITNMFARLSNLESRVSALPVVGGGTGSGTADGGAVGVTDTDTFERTSSSNLGSTWLQFYGSGGGTWAIPNGHDASWATSGTSDRDFVCVRNNPAIPRSQTDYQRVTLELSSKATRFYDPLLGTYNFCGFDDIWLRISDATTSLANITGIRIRWGGDGGLYIHRFVNGAGTQLAGLGTGGIVAPGPGANLIGEAGILADGALRTFRAKIGSSIRLQVTEIGVASGAGAANRRWGHGGRAEGHLLPLPGQESPGGAHYWNGMDQTL